MSLTYRKLGTLPVKRLYRGSTLVGERPKRVAKLWTVKNERSWSQDRVDDPDGIIDEWLRPYPSGTFRGITFLVPVVCNLWVSLNSGTVAAGNVIPAGTEVGTNLGLGEFIFMEVWE